jgi:predicted DNA-binding protein
MKKKISLQLSDAIVEKLKAASEERGVNRSIIVEKALERFLIETNDDVASTDRIERIDEQLRSIRLELKAINETVTLHARYNLAATSLMRGSDRSSTGHLAEISGQGLMKRNPRTRINSINSQRGVSRDATDDAETDWPLGAPTQRTDRRPRASSVPEVAWGLPAAAEEGGSEDYFRGPRR